MILRTKREISVNGKNFPLFAFAIYSPLPLERGAGGEASQFFFVKKAFTITSPNLHGANVLD